MALSSADCVGSIARTAQMEAAIRRINLLMDITLDSVPIRVLMNYWLLHRKVINGTKRLVVDVFIDLQK